MSDAEQFRAMADAPEFNELAEAARECVHGFAGQLQVELDELLQYPENLTLAEIEKAERLEKALDEFLDEFFPIEDEGRYLERLDKELDKEAK